MKENKVENLIWIIFAIIGAILVVIGFILFGSVFNYNNKIEIIECMFHTMLMEERMNQS